MESRLVVVAIAAKNPVAVLDVPLSAVADTVTLPVAAAKAVRRAQ